MLADNDDRLEIWLGSLVDIGVRGDATVYSHPGLFMVVADKLFAFVANGGGLFVGEV